jgi:hypothetical protein
MESSAYLPSWPVVRHTRLPSGGAGDDMARGHAAASPGPAPVQPAPALTGLLPVMALMWFLPVMALTGLLQAPVIAGLLPAPATAGLLKAPPLAGLLQVMALTAPLLIMALTGLLPKLTTSGLLPALTRLASACRAASASALFAPTHMFRYPGPVQSAPASGPPQGTARRPLPHVPVRPATARGCCC